jgi:hypothetical protein
MSASLPAPEPSVERGATPGEIGRIAQSLAHTVNNRLVLPLGLLELLEARADVPAELQLLFAPARQALQEMAVEAKHLEALTRLDQ